jgi:hypothetical protein
LCRPDFITMHFTDQVASNGTMAVNEERGGFGNLEPRIKAGIPPSAKQRYYPTERHNRTGEPSYLLKIPFFFLNWYTGGWSPIGPLHSALRLPIGLLHQAQVILMMEKWVNACQRKLKYSEETCPSASLSNTKPTYLSGREPVPPPWEVSD